MHPQRLENTKETGSELLRPNWIPGMSDVCVVLSPGTLFGTSERPDLWQNYNLYIRFHLDIKVNIYCQGLWVLRRVRGKHLVSLLALYISLTNIFHEHKIVYRQYIPKVCGLPETSEGRASCLSISPLSGSSLVSSVSIKPDTPAGFLFCLLLHLLSYRWMDQLFSAFKPGYLLLTA